MDRFQIDPANSDDEYLYVDIPSRCGTVVIKIEDEGLVVEIFSLAVSDEAVTSTWATTKELRDG